MLRVRVAGTGTESVFTQVGVGAGLAAAVEELVVGAQRCVGAARARAARKSVLCWCVYSAGHPPLQSAWSYIGHKKRSKGHGWHLSEVGGEPLKRCPVPKRRYDGVGTIGVAEERKGQVPLLCLRAWGQGGLK